MEGLLSELEKAQGKIGKERKEMMARIEDLEKEILGVREKVAANVNLIGVNRIG